MSIAATDWRFVFDERAAILEYDAGCLRREAEDRAWRMTIELYGAPPSGLTLAEVRRA